MFRVVSLALSVSALGARRFVDAAKCARLSGKMSRGKFNAFIILCIIHAQSTLPLGYNTAIIGVEEYLPDFHKCHVHAGTHGTLPLW